MNSLEIPWVSFRRRRFTLAYEFVEAFSSVFPKIRISQILAILGILMDLAWRLVSHNFVHPSFIEIPAALLVGFYLGKRPKVVRTDEGEKSKWIRLS
jgi:membrane associated rhomboid family serine protease